MAEHKTEESSIPTQHRKLSIPTDNKLPFRDSPLSPTTQTQLGLPAKSAQLADVQSSTAQSEVVPSSVPTRADTVGTKSTASRQTSWWRKTFTPRMSTVCILFIVILLIVHICLLYFNIQHEVVVTVQSPIAGSASLQSPQPPTTQYVDTRTEFVL